jgi:hypothetical protein
MIFIARSVSITCAALSLMWRDLASVEMIKPWPIEPSGCGTLAADFLNPSNCSLKLAP